MLGPRLIPYLKRPTFMCVSLGLHACVCTTYMPGIWYTGRSRAQDPLEPKYITDAFNLCVGTQLRPSAGAASALDPRAASPPPPRQAPHMSSYVLLVTL